MQWGSFFHQDVDFEFDDAIAEEETEIYLPLDDNDLLRSELAFVPTISLVIKEDISMILQTIPRALAYYPRALGCYRVSIGSDTCKQTYTNGGILSMHNSISLVSELRERSQVVDFLLPTFAFSGLLM